MSWLAGHGCLLDVGDKEAEHNMMMGKKDCTSKTSSSFLPKCTMYFKHRCAIVVLGDYTLFAHGAHFW